MLADLKQRNDALQKEADSFGEEREDYEHVLTEWRWRLSVGTC